MINAIEPRMTPSICHLGFIICHFILAIPFDNDPNAVSIHERRGGRRGKRIRLPGVRRQLHHGEGYRARSHPVAVLNSYWRLAGLSSDGNQRGALVRAYIERKRCFGPRTRSSRSLLCPRCKAYTNFPPIG